MDNNEMNQAIENLSKKIKKLKKQGANGEQIQAAVFDMFKELDLNIPMDKIAEQMKGMNKNDGK
jgi:predicted  nucleic acid-binding Zn-ribbon protein